MFVSSSSSPSGDLRRTPESPSLCERVGARPSALSSLRSLPRPINNAWGPPPVYRYLGVHSWRRESWLALLSSRHLQHRVKVICLNAVSPSMKRTLPLRSVGLSIMRS